MRVRLNAMAAQTSQALLAQNRPEVIWSRSLPVHDVRDGGESSAKCVVDAITFRRPTRDGGADAGAAGGHAGLGGGVLDGDR